MKGNRWEYFEVGMQKAEWLGMAEGLLMNWSNESGFTLSVFYKHPTKEEIQAMQAGSPFEIAFRDFSGVGFFGVKFGDLPWGDCAFSPNLYKEKPIFDEPRAGKTYALHIMLIDTGVGEIKVLRSLALGREFSDYICQWANKSLKRDMAKFTYNRMVDMAFRQYPTPMEMFLNPDAKWVKPDEDKLTLKVEEKE